MRATDLCFKDPREIYDGCGFDHQRTYDGRALKQKAEEVEEQSKMQRRRKLENMRNQPALSRSGMGEHFTQERQVQIFRQQRAMERSSRRLGTSAILMRRPQSTLPMGTAAALSMLNERPAGPEQTSSPDATAHIISQKTVKRSARKSPSKSRSWSKSPAGLRPPQGRERVCKAELDAEDTQGPEKIVSGFGGLEGFGTSSHRFHYRDQELSRQNTQVAPGRYKAQESKDRLQKHPCCAKYGKLNEEEKNFEYTMVGSRKVKYPRFSVKKSASPNRNIFPGTSAPQHQCAKCLNNGSVQLPRKALMPQGAVGREQRILSVPGNAEAGPTATEVTIDGKRNSTNTTTTMIHKTTNNNLIELRKDISDIQSQRSSQNQSANKVSRELASTGSQQMLSRKVSRQSNPHGNNTHLDTHPSLSGAPHGGAVTNASSSKLPTATASRGLRQKSPRMAPSDVKFERINSRQRLQAGQYQQRAASAIDMRPRNNRKLHRKHLQSAAIRNARGHILTPNSQVEQMMEMEERLRDSAGSNDPPFRAKVSYYDESRVEYSPPQASHGQQKPRMMATYSAGGSGLIKMARRRNTRRAAANQSAGFVHADSRALNAHLVGSESSQSDLRTRYGVNQAQLPGANAPSTGDMLSRNLISRDAIRTPQQRGQSALSNRKSASNTGQRMAGSRSTALRHAGTTQSLGAGLAGRKQSSLASSGSGPLFGHVIDQHIQHLKSLRKRAGQKPDEPTGSEGRKVFVPYTSSPQRNQQQPPPSQSREWHQLAGEASPEAAEQDVDAPLISPPHDKEAGVVEEKLKRRRHARNKPLTQSCTPAQTLELQKSLDLLSAYGQYRSFIKVNKGFIKAHGLGKKIHQMRSSKAAVPDPPASPSRQLKIRRDDCTQKYAKSKNQHMKQQIAYNHINLLNKEERLLKQIAINKHIEQRQLQRRGAHRGSLAQAQLYSAEFKLSTENQELEELAAQVIAQRRARHIPGAMDASAGRSGLAVQAIHYDFQEEADEEAEEELEIEEKLMQNSDEDAVRPVPLVLAKGNKKSSQHFRRAKRGGADAPQGQAQEQRPVQDQVAFLIQAGADQNSPNKSSKSPPRSIVSDRREFEQNVEANAADWLRSGASPTTATRKATANKRSHRVHNNENNAAAVDLNGGRESRLQQENLEYLEYQDQELSHEKSQTKTENTGTEAAAHDPVISRDAELALVHVSLGTGRPTDKDRLGLAAEAYHHDVNDEYSVVRQSRPSILSRTQQAQSDDDRDRSNYDVKIRIDPGPERVQDGQRSPTGRRRNDPSPKEPLRSLTTVLPVPADVEQHQVAVAKSQVAMDRQEYSDMQIDVQEHLEMQNLNNLQRVGGAVHRPSGGRILQKGQAAPALSGLTPSDDGGEYEDRLIMDKLAVLREGESPQKRKRSVADRQNKTKSDLLQGAEAYVVLASQQSVGQPPRHLTVGESDVGMSLLEKKLERIERRESHVTSGTTKTKAVPDNEDCVIAEMPVPVRREESQMTQQLVGSDAFEISITKAQRIDVYDQSEALQGVASAAAAGPLYNLKKSRTDKLPSHHPDVASTFIVSQTSQAMISQAIDEKPVDAIVIIDDSQGGNEDRFDKYDKLEQLQMDGQARSSIGSRSQAFTMTAGNESALKQTFNAHQALNDSLQQYGDPAGNLNLIYSDYSSQQNNETSEFKPESTRLAQAEPAGVHGDESAHVQVHQRAPQPESKQALGSKDERALNEILQGTEAQPVNGRRPESAQLKIVADAPAAIGAAADLEEGADGEDFEYYDEEEDEEQPEAVNLTQAPQATGQSALDGDHQGKSPSVEYGQQPTQQQVLQMKVEELTRQTKKHQLHMRQQNQPALVIEEATARREQSEKGSKQDSATGAENRSYNRQPTWSQVSIDQVRGDASHPAHTGKGSPASPSHPTGQRRPGSYKRRPISTKSNQSYKSNRSGRQRSSHRKAHASAGKSDEDSLSQRNCGEVKVDVTPLNRQQVKGSMEGQSKVTQTELLAVSPPKPAHAAGGNPVSGEVAEYGEEAYEYYDEEDEEYDAEEEEKPKEVGDFARAAEQAPAHLARPSEGAYSPPQIRSQITSPPAASQFSQTADQTDRSPFEVAQSCVSSGSEARPGRHKDASLGTAPEFHQEDVGVATRKGPTAASSDGPTIVESPHAQQKTVDDGAADQAQDRMSHPLSPQDTSQVAQSDAQEDGSPGNDVENGVKMSAVVPASGSAGERRTTQAKPSEDLSSADLREARDGNAQPSPSGIRAAEQTVADAGGEDAGEEYDEEADYYDEEVEASHEQPQKQEPPQRDDNR